jgi:DNA-binding CsgD family transcriptional regulator
MQASDHGDAHVACRTVALAPRPGARQPGRMGRQGFDGLFDDASAQVRTRVAYDAAAWVATDPASGLPLAPSALERLDALPRPAWWLEPRDADHALRVDLCAGGCVWGRASLLRRADFTTDEHEHVSAVCAPLGAALRGRVRALLAMPTDAPDAGPGMLLFAPDGTLIARNDDAATWLRDLGGDVPEVVATTRLQACADGQARTRAPGASGRWLVCHASCLRGVDDRPGETALVIEPATAADLAPLTAEAYELSTREREIAELIAQGCGTAEIAGRLHLSPHTIRDHVKTLFEKLGVTTRGQLVAHLFADPPR